MLPGIPSFQTSELQPPAIQDEMQLLTAKEAARLLSTSSQTVFRLIWSGELRQVRFGRTVRVKRCDLEEFIKNHYE